MGYRTVSEYNLFGTDSFFSLVTLLFMQICSVKINDMLQSHPKLSSNTEAKASKMFFFGTQRQKMRTRHNFLYKISADSEIFIIDYIVYVYMTCEFELN